MKMSKKVREYKSGDFIFAKVKGYPAWPARVQRMMGKKYFVYFYGTGETANLPPNMIFDYAENKDKFLTKTVKRRDFNDGVKQIEHDFANNVPLEQVVGVASDTPDADDTINDSANETIDESLADTTAADDTMVEESAIQNDTAIEDSDDTGALVIDEGKATNQKGRKSIAKTLAKEAPKLKESKTPRGKSKREDEETNDEKKEEEIVSRSGRKIRPKRYIDEQTEENATLPSPAPKKRRGVSPVLEKDKEKEKDKPEPVKEKAEKIIKEFNAVPQSELEDMKEPFVPDDAEKDNVMIAYLPSGQYIGVKLFQSRPNSFKNDNARLQWDKQAASNAITLKMQLEKGQIPPQSVCEQLVMDLNLTEEEKATLDKERETEEKKSRVQFLKTEMKLIELDTKIKTCLCLEKADTELCLKLLDELMDLDIKPLMLLKHPSCLETVKRMRAYVGNTPSWDLSEEAVLLFTQHAQKIRETADVLYNSMKDLFKTPEGLSFWEFFTERVALFKKVTAKLTSDELLELVHEPLEMSVPTSHTMKAAIDAANEEGTEEESPKKKINTTVKAKKVNNTPSKAPLKRQSSRRQQEEQPEENDKEEDKSKEEEDSTEEAEKTRENKNIKKGMKEIENKDMEVEFEDKEKEKCSEKDTNANKEANESDQNNDERKKSKDDKKEDAKEKSIEKDKSVDNDKSKDKDKNSEKEKEKIAEKEKNSEKEKNADKEKNTDKEKSADKEKNTDKEKSADKEKNTDKEKSVDKEKNTDKEKNSDKEKSADKEKSVDKDKGAEKNDKKKEEEKEKEKDKSEDEPRAKRSRETKKTEPPPRSPTKRKSKMT